jgi:hypothetical protein
MKPKSKGMYCLIVYFINFIIKQNNVGTFNK